MSDLGGTVVAVDELSDQDRQVLDVAARFDLSAGLRGLALPASLGLSPMRFFQVLDGLLDRPAAEMAEPVLVHRLRRVRDGARRASAQRRRAISG